MLYNPKVRQHPVVEEHLNFLQDRLIALRGKKKTGGKTWCLLDEAAALCEAVIEDDLSYWAEFYEGFNAKNRVLSEPELPKQLELFPESETTK